MRIPVTGDLKPQPLIQLQRRVELLHVHRYQPPRPSSPPTRQPGGVDHTSFRWIGLQSFGFLQDPIEYSTRTHHSNMDVYGRVQQGNVMRMSVMRASFAYHSAMRPEMLPRLAMPKPLKGN